MKSLLLPVLTLLSTSFVTTHSYKNIFSANDSTINHVLDGKISEWPSAKFEEDKGTDIKYAVDNDSANLYVAMMIPNLRTQFKLMGQGMELFVDVKGKKREGKGIAFPVKKGETNFGNFAANKNNDGEQKPDMTQMRSMVGINLLSLRLIGFDDDTRDQELMQGGSVNIQYSWDDANVMYIEYKIPMNLFSENSLNQKTISFGWKINGVEMPQVVTTSSTIVGVPSNGRGGGRPPSSGFNNQATNRQPSDSRMQEQSFWTKYTVTSSK